MNDFFSTVKSNFVRFLPFAIVVALLILLNRGYLIITPHQLFNYSPNNLWLAIVFVLLLYVTKPIAFFLPIAVVQITTAMIFSPLQAIILNLIGLAICCTLSYVIGYKLGRKRVESFVQKYKKTQLLMDSAEENQHFYIFIVRAIGVVPIDLTSMFLGSLKVNFPVYMIYSVLGLTPSMLITTAIGQTIQSPTSPTFIISILLKITLIITSVFIYKKKFPLPTEEEIPLLSE